MSFRLRPMLRLCLPALLLPLTNCGPGRNQFAPVCPVARLVPALADVTRYAGSGVAHDVTDMILQARIVSVRGSCQAGDDPAVLPASVQVGVSVQRGPGMPGREADIPVFLAVTEGDTVRDKQVFPIHIVFPPNVDRLTLTSPGIAMALPVTRDVSGASYGIIAGFQLSADELEANRRNPVAR